MKDKDKILVVGAGVLTAAGLAYLATRKPPTEEGEAALSIVIRDAEGNIIPHNSPANVYEGQSYTVTVSMTNTSTRGGAPIEAELTLRVSARSAGGVWLIPTTDSSDVFPAGGTLSYTYPMYVPWGTGGTAGVIDAVVGTPAGAILASDSETLNIIAVAIIYGATVDIGV